MLASGSPLELTLAPAVYRALTAIACRCRTQAETLARVLYAVKRDPHDAALFYAALGKTTLLQGECSCHFTVLTVGCCQHMHLSPVVWLLTQLPGVAVCLLKRAGPEMSMLSRCARPATYVVVITHEAGQHTAQGCRRCVTCSAPGLFRQAGVKKLADFLARDFRQPAARAAAAKNAFVLLGQHRHDLAAVFFILSAICCSISCRIPESSSM